jgi:phage FluMu protein Com
MTIRCEICKKIIFKKDLYNGKALIDVSQVMMALLFPNVVTKMIHKSCQEKDEK